MSDATDAASRPDDVIAALDAGIPAGWECDGGHSGACAAVPERFAESFAKWATGDIGVDLYIGYRVPPPGPTLYIDPPEAGPFGEVAGRIGNPVIDRPDGDEPLLRFVDLGSVHIGRARAVTLADGMRAAVETPAGAPLVAVGEVERRRIGLVAFALAESDLPLQVAFPLLMSNLVDALLPSGDGLLPSSTRLGQTLTL
ncbi:MAG: hypothetical protein KY438_10340, partial [Actinobacteria bacterium]|nr:hypothetical protein [Actinomycetota bacterium]